LAEDKDFSKKKSRVEHSDNKLEDNASLIAMLKNIGAKCENCERRVATSK
jgi:hypothetical protein